MRSPGEVSFIAVDWGTSRFRAYLVNERGEIAGQIAAGKGISAVEDGMFAEVLDVYCGMWLELYPKAPMVMAGMIGSRNGWVEVPYAPCPASPRDLARGLGRISIRPSRGAAIVPGVICHSGGAADVMRGEETLVCGTGLEDGAIIIPGTHSKWITIAGGKITSFRTYMTGEVYGLLRQHSVLRLLAGKPDEPSGFERGYASASREGGLLHQMFEARTSVLEGAMAGQEVGPFLSGLLIASEIRSAGALLAKAKTVILIAEGELAANYAKVFEKEGISFSPLSPATCLVAGLRRILQVSV